MGSTRLPGKVLQNILDKPMLWHIVERLGSIPEIAKVIVATSDQKADDRIAHFCQSNGISCFRGSETDVLDRFYQAAKNETPDAVIRITGDCPLIDPHLVRRLLLRFIESAAGSRKRVRGARCKARNKSSAHCALRTICRKCGVRGAK